jgi:multicomponent Na+:H+ antiporter subunit C
MEDLLPFIIGNYNYWISMILMLIGMYGMIAKDNLFKKIIGMSIFQSAIILFYISLSVKKDGSVPILKAEDIGSANINVAGYDNPLPHVLMLTAIVVGVAILGVALAVLQKVHHVHDTVEEDKILESMQE